MYKGECSELWQDDKRFFILQTVTVCVELFNFCTFVMWCYFNLVLQVNVMICLFWSKFLCISAFYSFPSNSFTFWEIFLLTFFSRVRWEDQYHSYLYVKYECYLSLTQHWKPWELVLTSQWGSQGNQKHVNSMYTNEIHLYRCWQLDFVSYGKAKRAVSHSFQALCLENLIGCWL